LKHVTIHILYKNIFFCSKDQQLGQSLLVVVAISDVPAAEVDDSGTSVISVTSSLSVDLLLAVE
jgi:hypothetical protein